MIFLYQAMRFFHLNGLIITLVEFVMAVGQFERVSLGLAVQRQHVVINKINLVLSMSNNVKLQINQYQYTFLRCINNFLTKNKTKNRGLLTCQDRYYIVVVAFLKSFQSKPGMSLQFLPNTFCYLLKTNKTRYTRSGPNPAIFIFIQSMNNHFTGSNILRNSYGYQGNDSPILRSPNSKGFPMGFPPPCFPQPDNITNSIQQLGSKIQGMQSRIRKKNTQEMPPQQTLNQKHDVNNAKTRRHFPMPTQQQLIGEQILRGSCQDILKKFDYSNLRNTTNFNVMNKVTTHNQLRRSPKEQYGKSHVQMNRTMTQDYSNTFLKPNQKKILENKHSFMSPNRTPPKFIQEKKSRNGASPHKYKNNVPEFIKTSDISKASTKTPQKKVFGSLNQIFQNRGKEKNNRQAEKNHSKIINSFEIGKQLGKGKFGEVFLTRHHETGFIAAIKKIEKKKVKQFKMEQQFVKQIRLHSCLDHPNIVKFYGVFEQKDDIYLVMEYLNGGTLFDCLNEVSYLPVKTAVEYLKDIIEALTYMHDKSIAHRDIKPENIVISSQGVAKLCDFGWSAVVQTTRKTYCGTFDYAPPQILQRKNYDTSVDIWCIGVLTYELLQGRVPFEGEQRNVVMQKIVNIDKNKLDYSVDIPTQAKQFIECLVQKDPALRPKCHDLLKFPLFTNYLSKAGKQKKQT